MTKCWRNGKFEEVGRRGSMIERKLWGTCAKKIVKILERNVENT